jgi:ribose transport system substrate-binding protein
MQTRNSAALAISILALTVLGCGKDPPKAPDANTKPGATTKPGAAETPKKRGTIGVSVMAMTNPFFKEIGDVITTEAAKAGYEVLVVSGDDDPVKQHNQVKDFIVRKCAAIVLTPCNSKAVGAAIQEANAAGIPVFTADVACLADGAKVVTHVATDNLQGGREAGKAMLEVLGPRGGKIAILSKPAVESCQLRVKGFREVIDAHNALSEAKIEIVKDLDADGDRAKGFRQAEDILQAHADLAAIFAINDPSALGARSALEKAGKADSVKLIGFDGQPEGKKAIKAGAIYADPIQFPDQIAIKTVQSILKHFDGEKPDATILIPTALYRKADAEKDAALK